MHGCRLLFDRTENLDLNLRRNVFEDRKPLSTGLVLDPAVLGDALKMQVVRAFRIIAFLVPPAMIFFMAHFMNRMQTDGGFDLAWWA